jgi:hypothetical protein
LLKANFIPMIAVIAGLVMLVVPGIVWLLSTCSSRKSS